MKNSKSSKWLPNCKECPLKCRQLLLTHLKDYAALADQENIRRKDPYLLVLLLPLVQETAHSILRNLNEKMKLEQNS